MPWAVGAERSVAPPRTVLTEQVLEGLNSGKIAPTEGAATVPGITKDNFPAYLLDCLWAVVNEELEADRLPQAIRAAGPQEAVSSTLVYAFLVVWADIEGPHRDSFSIDIRSAEFEHRYEDEEQIKLMGAVKACRQDDLVTAADLLEVLDAKMLQHPSLGLTLSPATGKGKSLATHMVSARTLQSQKIIIYPAFREDTEGYAKLLTLLNNGAISQLDNAEALNKEVDQLTGFYRLAPVKVAYCTLCAIEQQPAAAQVRAQHV